MTPHTKDELDIRFGSEQTCRQFEKELQKLPTMFGGDGKTYNNPVFVNCASKAFAKRLITRFISKTHGKIDVDWKVLETSILPSPSNPEGAISHYKISTVAGEDVEYYFDLSRSTGDLCFMLRQAYEMKLLDETDQQNDTRQ